MRTLKNIDELIKKYDTTNYNQKPLNYQTALANSIKTLSKQALFNYQAFVFLKKVATILNETTLSEWCDDVLNNKGFIEFDKNHKIINCLCPFHNDGTPASIKVEAKNLHCWACKTIFNFYDFLNDNAVERNKVGGNILMQNSLNQWVEIQNNLFDKYHSINEMLQTAINLDNSLVINYPNFFFDSSKQVANLSKQSLAFLNALQTISSAQNQDDFKLVVEFFNKRGFYDLDFISQNQPFFLGTDYEIIRDKIVNQLAVFFTLYGEDKASLTKTEWLNIMQDFSFLSSYSSFNYSMLQNRIVIPLYNQVDSSQLMVNFDARAYNDKLPNANPKYLFLKAHNDNNQVINDIATELSISNASFLGLSKNNEINKSLPKNKNVFFSEGIFDSLSLIYAGSYGLCLFSKNISQSQIQQIKQLSNLGNNIILALDNDKVGIEAMLNTAKTFSSLDIDAKILIPFKTYNHNFIKDWNDMLLSDNEFAMTCIKMQEEQEKYLPLQTKYNATSPRETYIKATLQKWNKPNKTKPRSILAFWYDKYDESLNGSDFDTLIDKAINKSFIKDEGISYLELMLYKTLIQLYHSNQNNIDNKSEINITSYLSDLINQQDKVSKIIGDFLTDIVNPMISLSSTKSAEYEVKLNNILNEFANEKYFSKNLLSEIKIHLSFENLQFTAWKELKRFATNSIIANDIKEAYKTAQSTNTKIRWKAKFYDEENFKYDYSNYDEIKKQEQARWQNAKKELVDYSLMDDEIVNENKVVESDIDEDYAKKPIKYLKEDDYYKTDKEFSISSTLYKKKR